MKAPLTLLCVALICGISAAQTYRRNYHVAVRILPNSLLFQQIDDAKMAEKLKMDRGLSEEDSEKLKDSFSKSKQESGKGATFEFEAFVQSDGKRYQTALPSYDFGTKSVDSSRELYDGEKTLTRLGKGMCTVYSGLNPMVMQTYTESMLLSGFLPKGESISQENEEEGFVERVRVIQMEPREEMTAQGLPGVTEEVEYLWKDKSRKTLVSAHVYRGIGKPVLHSVIQFTGATTNDSGRLVCSEFMREQYFSGAPFRSDLWKLTSEDSKASFDEATVFDEKEAVVDYRLGDSKSYTYAWPGHLMPYQQLSNRYASLHSEQSESGSNTPLVVAGIGLLLVAGGILLKVRK